MALQMQRKLGMPPQHARSAKLSHSLAPVSRPRALPVVRAPRCRAAANDDMSIQFDVHGRHVDIDDSMREAVISRLSEVLKKFEGSQYVEGAGGVSHVDVRLMNTTADIKIHPQYMDKELHDTFLRQGELHATATGEGAWDSFEKAAEQLEHKLKAQKKPTPKKVDYRTSFGAAGRPKSNGRA